MILPTPPDRLLSRSEVLRRPGWNKVRLALLGEPDRLVINERNWDRPVKNVEGKLGGKSREKRGDLMSHYEFPKAHIQRYV